MAPIAIKCYPHIYKGNYTLEAVSSCVPYPGGKKCTDREQYKFHPNWPFSNDGYTISCNKLKIK